ncbi:DNA polymerase III subunit gamma/tau [Microbacterium sp. P05]|uniref:DNA polymerase III subunit gamma/tau n=1 Tax=Microbacterium sp. P05 TaxID=3366948 RepID=UPI003745E471
MTGRDDDALSWDGDDDPTLDVGVDAAPRGRAARGQRAADSEPIVADEPEPAAPAVVGEDAGDDDEPAGLGNVALVLLGLIAGAYLFFAIGWFIAGLRLQAVGGLPVSTVMLTSATIAATAAPVVWFVTTLALTRRSTTWVRFVWLIAGIVLLVPWPFLFTGALV